MAEEKKSLEQKQLRTRFVNETELPINFINVVNVRAGLEEFYLTLGAVSPVEIKDIEELKRLDVIDAQPFFRCAVTRTVMKQMIDLMENVYNQQTQQIDATHHSPRNESEE